MRVMSLSALLSGVVVAVLQAAQPGPPQLSPEAQELAKRFPYPVVRDLRGVVPPGPRPLPSPPLGNGPWTFQTTEAKLRVSVVTRGFSHPYGFTFLPGNVILITERGGALRVVRNGVIDSNAVAGVPKVIYRG